MDTIDQKIINMLQKRSGLLKGTFGGLLYFFPAIAARINKLEKAGIITGYHTTVNLEKLNYHVKAFIQVQLEPSQKRNSTRTWTRFPTWLNATASPVTTPK